MLRSPPSPGHWLLLCLAAALAWPAPSARAQERLELSLTEAVHRALEGNPSLSVARYDPQVAEAAVTVARAPFDPTFYVVAPDLLSGSYSTATSELEGVEAVESQSYGGVAGVSAQLAVGTTLDASLRLARSVTNIDYVTLNPRLSSALALTVTQPLLRGLGAVNRQGVVVARGDLAISREALRAQVQQVVLDTCEAYWELVFRGEDRAVKERALELAEEHLLRNQEQVRLGALAPVETIQAERAVADAQLQLVQAQLELADAGDQLRALLGMPAEGPAWATQLIPTDHPTGEAPAVDPEGAAGVALREDATVRQAHLSLENRAVELDGAQNQRLPQLDLVGGVALLGIGGTQNEPTLRMAPRLADPIGPSDMAQQMFTGDNYEWSVGLRLTVPLGNLEGRGRLEQATLREARARAAVTAAEQQAAVAARRAVRQLTGQREAVEAAQRARELAERQLDAEERKFAMGTTTNFQVLQFQRELAAARTQELRALVDMEIARGRLEGAQGTLLPWLGVALE